MKVPTPLALIAVAFLGGAAGWLLSTRLQVPGSPTATSPGTPSPGPTGTRKILFYQSAMHPWIKSDQPGNCTICGMKLTPVFDGDQGIQTQPGLVTLSSNAITTLNVATTQITRGPLIRTLRVAGTIDDDDTRHRFISAYVGGRLDELHVNYVGAEVRAGQPLARFYSPMLLEAERQYLALHEVSQLPVPRTDASPSTARSGDATDHLLLLESAAERLRQLGLTAEQIAALPGKPASNHFTEILSPVSGTVLNRFVYAGQNVMEGEKLFEIADFNTMWFRFDVYEQDLPWIAVGQEVEVTTPSLPGQSFKAPIQFIDPTLIDMTRSAKIRVELPNPLLTNQPAASPGVPPRRLLRHRLYADGRVQVTHPEVLLVPRSAVLSPDGHPVVYIDRSGGAYERRPVQLGRLGDQHFEVLGGLTADERVVTSGNLLIDAQAQLNLSVHGTASPPETRAPAKESKPTALPSLKGPQEEMLVKLLTTIDTLRGHLAWDDLTGFNTAATQLPKLIQQLSTAFAPADTAAPSGWQTAIHAITNASGIGNANDLRSARKSFHPLSISTVELVKNLRAGDSSNRFREIRIYQCPMTAEAFDGAPARAQWLQLAPPLRNPWFGKEMLECGVEVAP
jgi:Cu(I)/Ag(I) efflux system membrane fusion protein